MMCPQPVFGLSAVLRIVLIKAELRVQTSQESQELRPRSMVASRMRRHVAGGPTAKRVAGVAGRPGTSTLVALALALSALLPASCCEPGAQEPMGGDGEGDRRKEQEGRPARPDAGGVLGHVHVRHV